MRSTTDHRGPGLAAAVRPLLALFAAVLACLLVAGPVAAAEHYRSAAALREYDGGPKAGSAYLDRYFGGSPPGPTKTTVRVVMPKASPGAYKVQLVAGECFSEGFPLVTLAARATTSLSGATKLDRTLTLTTGQRRKVQQAYDAGSSVIVLVSKGDVTWCGKLGTPRYVP